MALGILSSGDIKPIVKYDGRAGRWSRIDDKVAIDITQNFAAIFDLGNIEVGWAKFVSGGAPDFQMVKIGAPYPARPSEEHKRAVRVMVKLGASCGGDLREFATAAGCAIEALDELHDAYLAAPEAKSGMVPIVQMTGSTARKTTTPKGTTTNYKPTLQIVKWIARPAEFDGDVETTPSVPPPAPPTAGRIKPPAAAPAAQPAMADTEF